MSAITGQHERIPDGAPTDSPARRGGLLCALAAPAGVAWAHRSLINRMANRAIAARYRDSLLGVLWAVLTPLAMLGVYTFVFAVVLKRRWTIVGSDAGGTGDFAVRVFLGLILFQLFAALMTQSPGLLKQHRALVKKSVFPLEALVMIRLRIALFDFAAGFGVFLALGWIIGGGLGWGVVLAPVAAVPIALLGLGVGWLLAGLGAYLNDLTPLAGTLSTLILFVSAVFYPIEIVPERWAWVIGFNPIAIAIDTARALAFGPMGFDAIRFGVLLVSAWVIAALGLAVFRRVRWGFADVL